VTVEIEKKGRPVKGRVITYLPARLISFVEQEAERLEMSKSRVVERIIERAQGTREEEADTGIYNFDFHEIQKVVDDYSHGKNVHMFRSPSEYLSHLKNL
jgi:hypothetical protein